MHPSDVAESNYIDVSRDWIQSFIIELDICPFASSVMDKILYDVLLEVEPVAMINQAVEMAQKLQQDGSYETGFLILPRVDYTFSDFYALSQILQDEISRRFPDKYVLVAFHPQFVYEGTDDHDTTNAVNRSPYPMIHFLSSESLDRSSDHPEIGEQITASNQTKLSSLTWKELHEKYGVPDTSEDL